MIILIRRYDYSNKENNCEKALFTLLYRCLHRSYCIFYSFIRCGSHAADGSWKRLANSKTMNVSEVSDEFLPRFRKIMKHFKLRGMFKNQIHFIINVTFFFFFFSEICFKGTPRFIKRKIELLKINVTSKDGTFYIFPSFYHFQVKVLVPSTRLLM